jgi:hypothetical protein
LIYAVGEILLVVIGILIALQINTLKEEKGNRKLEARFFHEVSIDLQKDSVHLEFLVKYYKNRVDQIEWLLTAVRNPSKPSDEAETGRHLEPLYYGTPPIHFATTYESAKSSGHFNLFQDNEKIKELTQYYTEINLLDDILIATQGIIYDQLEPIMSDYSLDYLSQTSGANVVAAVDVSELYDFVNEIEDNRQKGASVTRVFDDPKFESYLIGDMGRAFHALAIIKDRKIKLEALMMKVVDTNLTR